MATKDQIIKQIKYELSQLSARNSQFEFEDLCRHLSRARICSNILVSTGPVARTGDQGRDFETFKTYISRTEFSGSVFAKLISEGNLAFACSIQKDNIEGKIKSDVNKIMDSGIPVEALFFFTPHNIKVAERHDIQNWVKDQYSTHLEIFDGESISELLAESDVFWIAERFLGISAEFYTREEEGDPWYKEIYEKLGKEGLRFTYAEFYQIKNAGRFTIFNEKYRQDLPLWIDRLKEYLDIDYINLKWKAIYEIAWLSLKGFINLRGQEDQLKDYFSRIPSLINLQDIEDTANLLQYISFSISQDIVEISYDDINGWINQLIERVENLISQNPNPFSQCSLLMTRGFLALISNFAQVFQHSGGLDFSGAYEWWKKLVDTVDDAPLFHLDILSKMLNMFIIHFDKNPNFRELIESVDQKLSERKGGAIIAENCRKRAEMFYRNGEILKAIKEFHEAKLNWFNEETIHESLISMLMLSSYYNELGLTRAGKYYALATAFIALNFDKPMLKPLIPRALFLASSSDYIQGNWLNFLELARIGFYFHDTLSINPWDYDFHSSLYSVTFNLSMAFFVSKLFSDDLFNNIKEMVESYPIYPYVEHTFDKALATYGKLDYNKLWEMFEEQLLGSPFKDCVEVQNHMFSALGIEWDVKWQNTYDLTIISEQFISVLQILLPELIDIDLCLLKTKVSIEISLEEIEEPRFEPLNSNEGRKWKIVYPINYIKNKIEVKKIQTDVFSQVSMILYEISLLKTEVFKQTYNLEFFNTIFSKIFVGNTYIEVFKQIIDKDVFKSLIENNFKITEFEREFNLKVNEVLKWNNSLGPEYNIEKAVEYLGNRYQYSILPIKYTLERCVNNSDIMDTIMKLRDEGWLDWQILSAIADITLNYRLRQQGITDKQLLTEKFFEQMLIEENEDDIVIPTSEFSEENFIMSLDFNLISTLRIWGLECHQDTPDFPAIKDFLDVRYNNRTDDIDHEDYFNKQ